MTDNNDGTYSYTYNSANVGDISMTAVSGTTESNRITIEDIHKYITTNTVSFSSTSSGAPIKYSNIFELPTHGMDCEISCNLSTTNINGAYFGFSRQTSTSSGATRSYAVCGSYNGVPQYTHAYVENKVQKQEGGSFDGFTIQANNPVFLYLRIEGNSVKFVIENQKKVIGVSSVSVFWYVVLMSQGDAKTVTITDFKLKLL